jgi:hypothetical protein
MKEYVKIRPAIRLSQEEIGALDRMRGEEETVTCVIRRLVVGEVSKYVESEKSSGC